MKILFILCSVCISLNTFSQNAVSIDMGEQLINSTIKIQASKDTVINGVKSTITSYGTGFFFQFYVGKDTINTIVTNAHVVKRFSRGVLKFNGSKDSKPNYGDVLTLDLADFNKLWIYHPYNDLAILPLQPLLISIANKYNKGSFTISIPESLVPSSGKLDSLAAIEDVLMIGYPKGFGDSVNNLPIVRRGTTATPAYLNYNGLPQFLVDIPIYTGSSGSPIFIYNSSYVDKRGTMVFGIRAMLLGIVVQSQDYVAKGSVLSPKKVKQKTETLLPFGIAVVIKSSELMGLKSSLIKAINDPGYFKLFQNILK